MQIPGSSEFIGISPGESLYRMLASTLKSVLDSIPGPGSSRLSKILNGPASDQAIAPDSSRPFLCHTPEADLVTRLIQTYGNNEDLVIKKVSRLSEQCQAFINRFGDGPVMVLRAPARINILGEHVDYVSYIPTASLTFGSREHDMVMMFRPSPGGLVRGISTNDRFGEFQFDINDAYKSGADKPSHEDLARPAGARTRYSLLESQWLAYLYSRPAPAPAWENYVAGACRFAQMKYGSAIDAGFDFLLDSSIMSGGGASSSSALSVLSGAAIRIANGIEHEPAELATDSSQAEWYVGTRGGSMDHRTICLARPGSAVSISYSSKTSTWLPLPENEYRWVTFFTHPANKGEDIMNHYNDRAFVSRILIPAILDEWHSTNPHRTESFSQGVHQFEAGDLDGLDLIEKCLLNLPTLMNANEVRRSYPEAYIAANDAFPALCNEQERAFAVRERALHHLGEVRRVALAKEVLKGREEGQPASTEALMTMLGKLLCESHASLRDLYEVSTGEVEELIRIIESSGLACGARLMGGGFGGNVLALVPETGCVPLAGMIEQEYYRRRGRNGSNEGSVMVSTSGPGVTQIA